ncbi:MAG: flagellar hook-associated protein FlgK [Planctomycetaceae bacterium]
MRSFDIGLSALRSHQQTLAVLGNNIANASTPGYHRQRVNLADRLPLNQDGLLIGSGVEVESISRLRNQATAEAIGRNSALIGWVEQELATAQRIEALLTPGDNSVHAHVSGLFNRLEALANNPEIQAVRSEFLSAAEQLTQEFNFLDDSLRQLSIDAGQEVTHSVSAVNGLIRQIAELNQRIQTSRLRGDQPNDLLDRRDQIVSQLSDWVDAEVQTTSSGRELLVIDHGAIVVGTNPARLTAREGADGRLGVFLEDSNTAVPLASGRIRGLLESVNEIIPRTRDELATLATEIVRSIDQLHATGLNDAGGFRSLTGSRGVDDVNVPLSQSGLAFPITAGDLTISVTDTVTGLRTTHRIAVDPAVDSLSDLASRLDALPGVVAAIEPNQGQLLIGGEAQQLIEFAGRVDQVPDLTAFAGTAQPEFSGRYTGVANDNWTVTFSGAGSVGVTDGLTAEVRNQAGDLIATLDIGSTYEAGTPLEIADGVSLQFGPGTIAATDTFSVLTTANADEPGLLSALGINSLFTGSSPGNLGVRSDLQRNPSLLALAKTEFSGESVNAAAMAELRNARFASLNNRTFVETLADITAESGLDVQDAQNQLSQLDSFGQRLQADRDALSGVDPNEELLAMLEVEKAFQAAARFLTTVDQTIQEVLRIGG